jgi:non-ribosomal peptide synthase protein (TIGR01720 family)
LASVVAEHAEAARRRLAPRGGVMVQAVWFDHGAHLPGRLVIVVHHLAVDAVSWRILLPDLTAAWAALAAGDVPRLEPVATSFRRWAGVLAEQALARVGELDVWKAVLEGPDTALGSRGLDPAVDTVAASRTVSVLVPADVSEAVLTRVPGLFHAGVDDVLLAGLALAVSYWRRSHGHGQTDVLVDVEGHGRVDIDGVDLSRTVGWFTNMFPVRLDVGRLDWEEVWAAGPALGRVVKRVKEQVRALPDDGLGYGLLRYHNPDAGPVLAEFGRPQIAFNYLGRFDAGNDTDTTAGTDTGVYGAGLLSGADGQMHLSHCLTINAVARGTGRDVQLEADWSWPGGMLTDEQVSQLAEAWVRALRAMAEHAVRGDAGGHTPSDFAMVSIGQEELDGLEEALEAETGWQK